MDYINRNNSWVCALLIILTFSLTTLSIAQSDDGEDENQDDPVMCEGDTLNASVRTYINYLLVKNDPTEEVPDDDSGDTIVDEGDDEEASDDEAIYQDLGSAIKEVTTARGFVQRSPEVLTKSSSAVSLRDWKKLDSFNWEDANDNLTSESFPSSLDFLYDSDNCRSFEEIFSSISTSKAKKLTKANLKFLKSTVEAYQKIFKPILDIELITSSQYKSLNKQAKAALSVINKALAKSKR
jgi:hypothetical protein